MEILAYYQKLAPNVIAGRLLILSFFMFFLVRNVSSWRHNAEIVGRTLPLPNIALACGFFIEFSGVLLILLGVNPRIGALLLTAFTVSATLVYLRFWDVADPEVRHLQMIIFATNIAVVGGLLQMM